jgi:hypothetical protein
MAAAGRGRLRFRELKFFPLFDGSTIETPITSDTESRQPALTQKPVNRRRMDTQMLREFFYRKNFVIG